MSQAPNTQPEMKVKILRPILLLQTSLWAAGAQWQAVPLTDVVPERDSVKAVAGDGSVRLERPNGARAQARVAREIAMPAGRYVALSATVCAQHLWDRDARVVLGFVDAAGKQLGRVHTPYVVRNQTWTEVVGYGYVPSHAARGRVVLSLSGKSTSGEKGSAEFKNVRIRPVPKVKLTGPPLGVIRMGERLRVRLEVVDAPMGAKWQAELVDVLGAETAKWDGLPGQHERSFENLAPGYYELRWSVLGAGADRLRTGRASYAVIDPAPRVDRSPFAMDAGFSWGLVQKGNEPMARVASLLHAIGLRRTRDRFSLSGTYRARERLDCDSYLSAARAQTAAGLRVYQIMHDIPKWMAPDPTDPTARKCPPADLRDLYRFFELAAGEMAQDVDAWEIWNEPDIGFFAGRAEEYAGVLKAGYLGVKKGNPNAAVLIGSPARALSDWVHRVYESGAADYYDVFNYHCYARPPAVVERAVAFRKLQQAHGVDAPMWLTETGDLAVPVQGDVLAGERRQAAQYVQRYVLAAGMRIERVFAFYLQEWRAPGSFPFGVIRPDLSPRPSLPALAALTRLLGPGEPLGQDRSVPEGVDVHWFRTDAGPVAAAWAASPQPWPSQLARGAVLSMMGVPVNTPQLLDEHPVYVTGLDPPERLTEPPPQPVRRLRTAADVERLAVILDLRLFAPSDPAWGTPERKIPVRVVPGETVQCQLAAYNFASKPVDAVLALTLPTGWTVKGFRGQVRLSPGERALQNLRLFVGTAPPPDEVLRVRATASAAGFSIAPAVACVSADVGRLPVRVLRTLGAVPEGLRSWSAAHNEPVQMTMASTTDHAPWLRVTYQMLAPGGNRWGFANVPVRPEDGLPKAAGLQFRLRVTSPWNEVLRVILFEADGSQYHLSRSLALDQVHEREARLLWREFRLHRGVSRDENDRLDLDQISRIGFGVSAATSATSGAFDVRQIELIEFVTR